MNIRFAVVDDAAFLREIIKNILAPLGAVCVGEASDGEEALKLVKETLPDVIFLDMVMPVRNGIETAKAVKEIWPDLKIIGCSTLDDEALIERAYQAGFDEYITKPFARTQIVEAIKKVLPHLGDLPHG